MYDYFKIHSRWLSFSAIWFNFELVGVSVHVSIGRGRVTNIECLFPDYLFKILLFNEMAKHWTCLRDYRLLNGLHIVTCVIDKLLSGRADNFARACVTPAWFRISSIYLNFTRFTWMQRAETHARIPLSVFMFFVFLVMRYIPFKLHSDRRHYNGKWFLLMYCDNLGVYPVDEPSIKKATEYR